LTKASKYSIVKHKTKVFLTFILISRREIMTVTALRLVDKTALTLAELMERAINHPKVICHNATPLIKPVGKFDNLVYQVSGLGLVVVGYLNNDPAKAYAYRKTRLKNVSKRLTTEGGKKALYLQLGSLLDLRSSELLKKIDEAFLSDTYMCCNSNDDYDDINSPGCPHQCDCQVQAILKMLRSV
jgi:hypothetical protein